MTESESDVLCVSGPLVPTIDTAYDPVVVLAATDTVSTLATVPFAGGVTGVGLKPHVAPAGRPVHDRPTAELKPRRLPTVTVLAPLAPWAIVRLAGEAESVKSVGVRTESESDVLRVDVPLVPTIDTAYDPVGVLAATDTVSTLVAVPFAGGVTGVGLKPHVAPAGRPVHDRPTAELKPLRLATVTVLVPLAPWTIVTLEGEAERLKSGGGGGGGVTAKTRSSWSL